MTDESLGGGRKITANPRTVRSYIGELEKTKDSRPEQVKEGLELYVELWRKAISAGVVSEDDSVELALEKIEKKGGLYAAAEE